MWIPKDHAVETPIHLLMIATGTANHLMQPRILVVAESGSRSTIIEDYVALGDRAYFVNSVAEIHIASNATVTHSRIQRDSQSAFHIGKTVSSHLVLAK